MNPLPMLGEPAPGGKCRVCDTQLQPSSLTCSVCGAVYGESNRCPHCRAVAASEPAVGLGRCRVCGGARIGVQDPRVVRSGRESAVLRRAERARVRALGQFVATLATAATAAFVLLATLVTLALTDLGGVAAGAGLLLAAFPSMAAVMFFRRTRAARAERLAALDQAKHLVAADIITSHPGPMAASELARSLGIELADAELLLADFEVTDFLHGRVTEEGELRPPAARVRVESGLEAGGSLSPELPEETSQSEVRKPMPG